MTQVVWRPSVSTIMMAQVVWRQQNGYLAFVDSPSSEASKAMTVIYNDSRSSEAIKCITYGDGSSSVVTIGAIFT